MIIKMETTDLMKTSLLPQNTKITQKHCNSSVNIVSERLEMKDRDSQRVYAFLVLGAVGNGIDVSRGLQLFFASLPVGICGLVSGIWQGRVSAAGMQLIARRPKQMGQAIILPAMVETFAVFGLLASILLMNLGQ